MTGLAPFGPAFSNARIVAVSAERLLDTEEAMKIMRKVVIASTTLLVVFSAVWIWLTRESEINVDDFKKLVAESATPPAFE